MTLTVVEKPEAKTKSLPTIQQEVQVNFRYDVAFTRGLFNPENPLLHETVSKEPLVAAKKVLVVVDRGVAEKHENVLANIRTYCNAHSAKMNLVRAPFVMDGGEASKNTSEYVTTIRDAVNEYGIDRHSYIVAVGGGAIIDMVGFAAATSHRGIRLIRVPTTVLAQNDAAVGVKNAINSYGKKNWLGTFAPPVAVLNDFDFLKTLDIRDWRGGISEAIKVALLKDVAFFEFMEKNAKALDNRDMPAMEWVIYRCAQLHLEHISGNGDPFEMGSSRPLDFGHWSAHKLEQMTNYELRHGEAVAIGIALDATYSHLKGMLPHAEWLRIIATFKNLGFKLFIPELAANLDDISDQTNIMRGLTEFREHLGGQLTIMLLNGIGKGVEVHDIDRAVMIQAIEHLRTYAND